MGCALRGLCVILDRGLLGGRDIAPVVRELLDAGVRWIQFRDKRPTREEAAADAARVARMCGAAGAALVINDRVPLVLSGCGDGVHLGQGDMPVGEARRLLGAGKIIGCSAHCIEEARRAEAEGADYLGVGAVFPTATKPDAALVGLEGLARICRGVRIPVIAVGGIGRGNLGEVFASGAAGIAVASAVLGAADPGAAARELLEAVREAMEERGGCHGR